jgi:hypothetical protein
MGNAALLTTEILRWLCNHAMSSKRSHDDKIDAGRRHLLLISYKAHGGDHEAGLQALDVVRRFAKVNMHPMWVKSNLGLAGETQDIPTSLSIYKFFFFFFFFFWLRPCILSLPTIAHRSRSKVKQGDGSWGVRGCMWSLFDGIGEVGVGYGICDTVVYTVATSCC